MQITFRPLELDDFADPPGWQDPFDSTYSQTLTLLDRELRHLNADDVVIQLALREDQIRLDGMPKAQATPAHPGVKLSFTSPYGPLVYRTNAFRKWHANLRAIALGLEALRKVDRYGITKRGEQYTGWKALPAGGNQQRAQRGRQLIAEHGSVRAAQRATHPDVGGDADDFAAIQAAVDEDRGR